MTDLQLDPQLAKTLGRDRRPYSGPFGASVVPFILSLYFKYLCRIVSATPGPDMPASRQKLPSRRLAAPAPKVAARPLVSGKFGVF
jgi:hypothetical protein